ncbi:MAG: hypothetical protein K6F86_12935 [Lachnospiraceae bacterium]|nr:hypothetical protein [Lachnospiraceae bacterium]
MKKIIIAGGGDDEMISGFADAFVAASVSVEICEKKELKALIIKSCADGVLCSGFDEGVAKICKDLNMMCIFLVVSFPAPELFSPALFFENNRIFIADDDMYEILCKTGHPRIYYAEAASEFKVISCDIKTAGAKAEKIMLHLENDELKFLQGLLKAQEVFPEKNILFRALGDDLVIKMYQYAGLSDRDVLLKKRYVISGCIFRPLVTKSVLSGGTADRREKDFDSVVKEILKNCCDF